MTEETQTTEAQPATEQKTNETKAFSDLYNQNKADREAWDAEKVELQTQIDELKKIAQTANDSSKDNAQLMTELNELRAQADKANGNLDTFNTSMKSMIEKSLDGLTDEQKKQVEFASDDPFKKMQFIQTLKGQSVTKEPEAEPETSQGGAVGGDEVVSIDVDDIMQRAANGDISAYREAKKKYGAKAVQRYVQEHSNAS